MNFAPKFATGSAIGTTVSPEGLFAIQQPGCAAMIWDRAPLKRFQSWLDDIPPAKLPKVRTVLGATKVRRAISHVCDLCETPDCQERSLLIDDIAALADIFATVMQTPYVMLRLDVVDTNACRKFHTDAVVARIICTYRGTGTQYGFSEAGAEPQNIIEVATGAPILRRGLDWPEHPSSDLVHRSPPIEGSGETRLVLVLDPVADPDAHLNQSHLH